MVVAVEAVLVVIVAVGKVGDNSRNYDSGKVELMPSMVLFFSCVAVSGDACIGSGGGVESVDGSIKVMVITMMVAVHAVRRNGLWQWLYRMTIILVLYIL